MCTICDPNAMSGMYIGQVDPISINTWFYDNQKCRMQKSDFQYSPALLKVTNDFSLQSPIISYHRYLMKY